MEPFEPSSTWRAKVGYALRGLVRGMREKCFLVHGPAAVAVVALGAFLNVSRIEWSLLVLCIALIFGAELFNTSLEALARAVTRQFDPHIEAALDLAAGAVTALTIGAVVIGLLVLGPGLWRLLT